MEKEYLTVKETAEYLSIPLKSLYNQIAPNANNPFPVKAKRIGRRIRFSINDLKKYMENN